MLGLLLTSQDCYSGDLNFVFGVARRSVGAIVSTYHLGNDPDFVVKECVHEIGHAFGLDHCQYVFASLSPSFYLSSLCNDIFEQCARGAPKRRNTVRGLREQTAQLTHCCPRFHLIGCFFFSSSFFPHFYHT
eukprot:TRINITY_DN11081_c0_g1_i1.p1 TRINITY_DN11081_c0_g1~~TRINITY_DN11081_c0_g1_i1.p1  ORF type:complete len:132 (-),score=6.80 TRINITY_DN11081_c0_g1_i1:43-438(-)